MYPHRCFYIVIPKATVAMQALAAVAALFFAAAAAACDPPPFRVFWDVQGSLRGEDTAAWGECQCNRRGVSRLTRSLQAWSVAPRRSLCTRCTGTLRSCRCEQSSRAHSPFHAAAPAILKLFHFLYFLRTTQAENATGAWPLVLGDGTVVNGGVPQVPAHPYTSPLVTVSHPPLPSPSSGR
jgi:hypothetical protein